MLLTSKDLRAQKSDMKFNEKLEKLIAESGVTNTFVAKLVQVNGKTITNWRAGAHQPPFEKIAIIAKHFNVPFGWLVDPDDSRDEKQARLEEKWLQDLRELHPDDARRRIVGAPQLDQAGRYHVTHEEPNKDETKSG